MPRLQLLGWQVIGYAMAAFSVLVRCLCVYDIVYSTFGKQVYLGSRFFPEAYQDGSRLGMVSAL